MWLAQTKSTLDRDSIGIEKFISRFSPWTSIRQCREIFIDFFRDFITHLRFHMLLWRSYLSEFNTFSDSINFHEACNLTLRCLTFHACALVNGETINKEAALIQCVSTTSCAASRFLWAVENVAELLIFMWFSCKRTTGIKKTRLHFFYHGEK
jgi:hypothetical protein